MRSELEVIGGNFSVVEKIEKELEKEICELAEFQGPKSQVGELNSRIQELLKEIGKQLQVFFFFSDLFYLLNFSF